MCGQGWCCPSSATMPGPCALQGTVPWDGSSHSSQRPWGNAPHVTGHLQEPVRAVPSVTGPAHLQELYSSEECEDPVAPPAVSAAPTHL